MLEKFHRKYIGDRNFYKRYIALALPMIIQNAVTNLVSFLDNIMVGQLGTEPVSYTHLAVKLKLLMLVAESRVTGQMFRCRKFWMSMV